MAELHSNIYFKHDDSITMDLLDSLFYEADGDIDKFSSYCESINPTNGAALSKGLVSFVDEPEYDLGAESLNKIGGYSVCHFVHGSAGDEIIGEIIKFLYSLCPDIHAQAWGCGDDDPWEFWFKFENGSIKRKDDEPEMDQEEDEKIINTIYAWWHESMPGTIKEGLLNEIEIENENDTESEINIEGEHIVFTGKMENDTREDMEELAKDCGAIVQKSVNSKTTLLVVGEKPGASKLNKAKELNVRIVSETEFNNILER